MKQIAAPMNPRQMLMAFGLYDPAQDLPQFIARFDTETVTRRQVYFSILGRGPESSAAAINGPDYMPRRHIAHALRSHEFQIKIRERILAAFPEKRRLVFIHIPKCAGTDLEMTLRRRHPYLYHTMAFGGVTSKPALFSVLKEFATTVGLSDSIAISGHVPLQWYLERKLIRFEDEVFSTIRDPRDILYSHASYILMTLMRNRGTPKPDTIGWLRHLDMTDIEENPTPSYLAEIGGRILRNRHITTPNMLCHFLGAGTTSSALDSIVMTDIELTDMARYSAWRRQKFAFEPGARVNASQAQFTAETASPADRQLVDEMTTQDMPLYEKIMQKLAASDSLSGPRAGFRVGRPSFLQKRSKKLLSVLSRTQMDKSFLALFFKKELFLCLTQTKAKS